MKIFGREPAAVVAAIQAVLVAGVAFGWFSSIGLDGEDDVALAVGVLAALGALVNAWSTSQTVLAPLVEVFKATVAFVAIYGFTITPEQVTLVTTAVYAVGGAFQRTQVTPLDEGNFSLTA